MIRWSVRSLAVLLTLAAIDAAAATAHGAQPAFMAAVAGAATCVLALAILWNQPALAAGVTGIALGGAFAGATFALGSVDAPGNIAFTGFSSADSAAIVFSFGIFTAALFFIALIRNPIVRIAIAIVAVYALLPTILSIQHGGLPAAFATAPLATTRGTYVASQVLLPLATLGAIVAALWNLVKRRGAVAAAALLCALAFASAHVLGSVAAGAAGLPTLSAVIHSESAAHAALPPMSPEQASASLDHAAHRIPSKDYDLPRVAQQLTTADAAFAYVRDNIRFESYSGILRGARGTFYTRAGNAFDRAMLLAYFLNAQKVPFRFAVGNLAVSQSEQLFARIFEPASNATPPAKSSGSPQADALKDRVFSRARHDYDLMRSALGGTLPAVTVGSHDDVIKEIQQHAWVQATINGRWVDLDPSFPDSKVGHAYCDASQTSGSPPPALMQNVTIRVTTETLENGVLKKDVALEATFPAYQIIDRQVFLSHGAGGLQSIFGSKDAFRPVLVVDGDSQAGKPIAFGTGASAAGAASPGPVSEAANALGTAAPATQNANVPAFVAEWLEFEIAFPDGHKDVNRRVLVDRAGTAWRHATTLDASRLKDLPRNATGLLDPQTIYNIWFSAGKHNLPAYAQSVRELMDGTVPSDRRSADAPPTFNEQAWPVAMRDFAWFIVSDHALVPSLNDTPGLRFYADSPRIFMFAIGGDPTAQSGAGSFFFESDLRRDSLRGISKTSGGQAAIAEHKLWFGALEGALEHEMGAQSGNDPAMPIVTTSSLAEGGQVSVFRPGTGTTAAGDPETAVRIQLALANGDTLAVPKKVLAGGTSGWWQIAHDTGDVRAVLDEDLDAGKIPTRGTGSGYKQYGGRIGTPKYVGQPKVYDLSKYEQGPARGAARKGGGGGELGEYAATLEVPIIGAQSYLNVGLLVSEIVGVVAAIVLAATQ